MKLLKLEEFGSALFIDSELQVAEKDEKKYSGQFVGSALNYKKIIQVLQLLVEEMVE